ncbi:MAG TPA: class I SAM-dependent methyltransferase [Pyrinomonadaceae bacterium]|nr:class I SAM-dependent methyltransferase [Pyrinomonadaceae bacterium]
MIEKTRTMVQTMFPRGSRVYRGIRRVGKLLLPQPSIKTTFTRIYENNCWADPESVSGRGSTLARTEVIRHALPVLLESIGAKSLLDAACGDFNWMRHVDLSGIEYSGADVVPELVSRNCRLYGGKGKSFAVLDITRDPLPEVDVILCRDCLIHLSSKHVRAAIANFKRSNSSFLLATTHTTITQNEDTQSGCGRLVNLQLSPFNFPPPLQLITEDAELGKHLGLWSIEKLMKDYS